MKKLLKKIINSNRLTIHLKDLIKSSPQFRYDKKHYIAHHRGAKMGHHQLEYDVLSTSHALEKGMSFSNPRPFGKAKVADIVSKLSQLAYYPNATSSSAFIISINTLRQYAKFYEKHHWKNYPQYSQVKEFLSQYQDIPDVSTGTTSISREELLSCASINYQDFLKSRHSIRKFLAKPLRLHDLEKAINIARLTPSACNRQMVKVYFAKTPQTSKAVKKAIHGNLVGFDIDSANPLVITFDNAAFIGGYERNQGWLNAGLFSMNLVNALHSLGIGSCLCEFQQPTKTEDSLKVALNIPDRERIAVVIMTGYYPDQNTVYKSPRIPTSTILQTR